MNEQALQNVMDNAFALYRSEQFVPSLLAFQKLQASVAYNMFDVRDDPSALETLNTAQAIANGMIRVLRDRIQAESTKVYVRGEDMDERAVAQSVTRAKPDGGFDSVSGMHRLKRTLLHSFILPSIHPRMYEKSISRGVFLYGYPGTGKTYIVKAVVNELAKKLPDEVVFLVHPSNSDIKGKYVGQTEKRIEALFAMLKDPRRKLGSPEPGAKVRYVLFLDEIDSIARSRMTAGESGSSATTALLREINSIAEFNKSSDRTKITILAATNFPGNVDSAFIRRLDDKVLVDMPDFEAIRSVFLSDIANYWNRETLSNNKWDDYLLKDEMLKEDEKDVPLLQTFTRLVARGLGLGGLDDTSEYPETDQPKTDNGYYINPATVRAVTKRLLKYKASASEVSTLVRRILKKCAVSLTDEEKKLNWAVIHIPTTVVKEETENFIETVLKTGMEEKEKLLKMLSEYA